MEVNRVARGAPKCAECRQVRQEIDFSKVLENKRAGQNGPSPTERPEGTSGTRGPEAGARHRDTLVSLGTVSRENPNVSSLLVRHPVYKQDCWSLLYNEVNRNKPYTRIRPGTEIFLDPKTREIVWGKMLQAPAETSRSVAETRLPPPASEQDPAAAGEDFSERLVGAVKPFFGRPYGEMNCYELLVKGLTKLGVRYQGAGGLGRKLMGMAKEQGLPRYAYFNGEGLIAASGSPVYSKTLLKVRSPEAEAATLLNEIEPYLEKGQILSFSIHSRGHTGIVSQEKGTWTLINSGEMDHSLKANGLRKGVGEESLAAEVRNWFDLAESRRESLRITLGRLNEQKLLAYYDPPSTKPKKV